MAIDVEHSMLMPFIDNSESFVLGFECGCLWKDFELCADMRPDKDFDPVDRTVHVKNIEQIKMIADYFNRDLLIEIYDDEWALVSFSPRSPKLKLVKR